MIGLILAVLIASTTSYLVTAGVVVSGPVQRANARSSHHRPTPISGGLGPVAGCAAGVLALTYFEVLMPSSMLAWWMLAVLLNVLIGAWDDWRELGAVAKMTGIALGAFLLVLSGPGLTGWTFWSPSLTLPVWLSGMLAFAFVCGLTNTVNFMDGANGLIGSAVTIAALSLGAVLWTWGEGDAALVALALVAAMPGFLWFNARVKARCFLGDAGALALGTALSALALGVISQPLSGAFWLGVLVVLPLIVDPVLTVLDRARRGERLALAHRDHAYQRRLRAGQSHLRVSAGIAVEMLICGGVAVAIAAGVPDAHADAAGVLAVAAGLAALALRWWMAPRP